MSRQVRDFARSLKGAARDSMEQTSRQTLAFPRRDRSHLMFIGVNDLPRLVAGNHFHGDVQSPESPRQLPHPSHMSFRGAPEPEDGSSAGLLQFWHGEGFVEQTIKSVQILPKVRRNVLRRPDALPRLKHAESAARLGAFHSGLKPQELISGHDGILGSILRNESTVDTRIRRKFGIGEVFRLIPCRSCGNAGGDASLHSAGTRPCHPTICSTSMISSGPMPRY